MTVDHYRELEKTHVCAMCGGELVTIWDAENNCYVLCCGTDHTHNGFQQKLTATTALKRGQADQLIGPGAQRDLEKQAQKGRLALDMLPKKDIATDQALNIVQVQSLVDWAANINLNAYLGHICLYHGKPYITIDGYYYLNHKREQPYVIGLVPMNDIDRMAFALGDNDYGYIAEAWLGKERIQTTGVGIITHEEMTTKSARDPGKFRAPVVHDKPQRMAEKRAEWQLLRKLIPLEVNE